MAIVSKGIHNRSAECYMNSIFQCLIATHDFVKYLLTTDQKDDNNLVELMKNLIEQFQVSILLKNNSSTVHCNKLKQYIQHLDKMFSVGIQNDSQEFLIFLFDQMHNLLKKKHKYLLSDPDTDEMKYINLEKKFNLDKENDTIKHDIVEFKNKNYVDYSFYEFKKFKQYLYSKDYSEIQNIFGTIVSSEIRCIHCNNINISLTSELSITIQLENRFKTLYDCLNSYTGDEELTTDNSYKCDFCNKKSNAIKKLTIFKSPKNLIINFKRFRFSRFSEKINTSIECPMTLNIKKYTHNSLIQKGTIYKLYAINYHIGGPNGGHYYSDCKNFSDNMWYNCNDSSVSSNHSLNSYQDDVINTNAYILFYKKL